MTTKNSILNNSSKKRILKSELTEDRIQSALNEIFLYYSSLKSENNDIGNENNDDIKNKYLDLGKFYKFCYDFRIHLPKFKINVIFNQNCNCNGGNMDDNELMKMDFDNFKSSSLSISLEMNSTHKQKLIKIINEKRNIIDYMDLKELQRKEEEKNYLFKKILIILNCKNNFLIN